MTRRRIRALVVTGALLWAAALRAEAPPTGKVHRIGVLADVTAKASAPYHAAFRQALSELGSVEGQNLQIDYRYADDRPERLPSLATELVRLDVELIVTRGTPAALSARHATRTIPIVMASSGDPAGDGIVRNLARPGGNITGLHIMAPPDLGIRRLQLLKEVVPGLSRVGVLWSPVDIQGPLIVREIDKRAKSLGIQIRHLEVSTRAAFDQSFEAALMDQVDALIAVEHPLTFAHRSRIVDFAAMSRLPAMYGLREFVDAGGLMSYGTDRRDLFRRAAAYVHRILTGTRPGDLPVEPPAKFELAINLKTARALGLAIPPAVRQRAEYVVE